MKFRRDKKPKPEKNAEPSTQAVTDAAREGAREAIESATTVAILETWPQKRVILRIITIVLLVGLLVGLMVWVLYRLQGVLLLVVLSVFFAYLVAPLVELVHRPFKVRGRERVMPRPAAIGIVYLVLFGTLILALWILLPRLGRQITEFARDSAEYQKSAQGRIGGINDFCRNNGIPSNVCDALNDAMTGGIDKAKDYVATRLPNLIVEVLSFVPWLVLIPILSYFLLNDADDFRRSALQMLPRGRWRWRGDEFFQDVNSTLAAYVRAQLTACLLIGTICTVGFIALGVPFPLVLGVIAGMLEFIPLVGPVVVAIIAALVSGFNPDPTASSSSVLWVLLFLGVLRVVHDYSIYPRLIGQGVHLHPLAVILAILAGHELAGVAGIFLSIPVIAVATVSYRHWIEHRGGEGLVADLLQPAEETVTESAPSEDEAHVDQSVDLLDKHAYPTDETTPEEMARERPDLTTGELKMPKMD